MHADPGGGGRPGFCCIDGARGGLDHPHMATLKTHFEAMARYNAWANQRLYAAVEALPEEDYRRPCGAFFGSVEGTLNHLLVTDRIWLRRLAGQGDTGYALDTLLFTDFTALRQARIEEDAGIVAFVLGLSDAALATRVAYRRVSTPEPQLQRVDAGLAHWFNHQTHHRGQVHTLLTQLTGQAPALDLLVYQRQHGD